MNARHALVEVSDALRDLKNPADIAYTASALTGKKLKVSRVGYAEVDHDTETSSVVRDWVAEGDLSLPNVMRLRDHGSFVDSLKCGELTAIADVRLDDRTASATAALEARHSRSMVVSPVLEQGRLVAVFFVTSAQVRQWTDDEIELIKEVSDRTRTAVQRARAENDLRDSEEKYRTLFERLDEGFCIIEFIDGPHGPLSDYVHIQANSAYEINAGIPDIVGKRLREIVGEEEANDWAEIYRGVLTSGKLIRFERDLEATERHLELAAFRVDPASKRQVAVLFKDVSARKLAEKRLRELNETLESQVAARSAERDRLWNLSQDVLARADYTGSMSAVSPAWTSVFGWTQRQLLSRPYASFMHPDDTSATLEAIAGMAASRLPTRFENRIATADGQWKHIEWTVAPEDDGLNFIAVGRDVSEARNRQRELEVAQEALRQSQKMEAMGSLTGGVAHDFNNLLTPIIGSLDMLERKGIGSERERRLINGALHSAERAKTLVQRLLAFARRQPLQPVAVDLGQLLDGMVDLIGSTLGPTIDVRLTVTPDLPLAKADPNQLEMALLNLAVNARDAMPDGGELTVSADMEVLASSNATGLKPGPYVCLSVSDTGSGMDEETRRRAIEPFFSTKGIGKGTGLGLSMAHGLAGQLGGALVIDSIPDQGTTVRLLLPIDASAVTADPKTPASPSRWTRRGSVLLVDDEELVRMTTADMLVDMGFEIVEAASGEEALELVKGGLVPDLVVTDHLMPNMSGADLARNVLEIVPSVPILLVSGYAEVDGVAPDLPRLTKPFRNAELATKIDALLSVREA